MQVHHQVAINVAETHHRAGGKHVQHHLFRGACLHARGTGENLGSGLNDDCKLRGLRQRGGAIASDGDGSGSGAPRTLKRRDSERSASAGGQAYDNVSLARALPPHPAHAERARVFVGLGGPLVPAPT